MSSTKSKLGLKLRLMSAFGALLALALAVGCRGFFPATTYSAITIDPTSPQVALGGTESLQLWGTNSDGSGNTQITSGVDWSVSTGTTGTATFNNPSSAVLTGTGIGSITVNAAYQGLTATATGVVYLTNIVSICVSTNNSSGSCSPSTEDISISSPVNLYAIANYTNASGQTETIDITTSATWTLTGTDASGITCDTSSSPAVCTEPTAATTPGNVTVKVSYPQTSVTGTNTLDVTD